MAIKRAKKNVDEIGTYSTLLLYAIVLSFAVSFLVFHVVCAFVVTGFMTRGFADEWSSVLSACLTDWGIIRWTVGIPVLLYAILYFRGYRKIKKDGISNPYAWLATMYKGTHVHEINSFNGDDYLDALYGEYLKMCKSAGIKVPRLFYVEISGADGLNAFTTDLKDGTRIIVLYLELMKSLSFSDVKAVIAHEIGHIISKDIAYRSYIQCGIGVMTFCWAIGQLLINRTAQRLMNPSSDGDSNPMDWLLGVGALVLGNIMVLLGGFSNYCGMGINWLRRRLAELIADSRGALLLENEQDFADMIIMLHCKSEMYSSKSSKLPKEESYKIAGLTAPGAIYGSIAVHPDNVERVRRIRPSFDGDFRRAYKEIMAKRLNG